MKARWLSLALPLVGALLVVLGGVALSAELYRSLLTPLNLFGFAAAFAASVAAARAFGGGDYLRGAWALMAACYGLLLLDTILFGAANASTRTDASTTQNVLSGGLTIAANVATVIALLRVGRAWGVAGLDLQVSRAAYVGSMIAAFIVSSAIVSTGFVNDVRELADGKFAAVQGLASAFGDVAATVLLVPLFLTALSLRGGSLVWPWGLLTASTVLWLGVDALDLLSGALGATPEKMVPFEEACRFAACLFQVTAGLAQRDIVKGG